MSLLQCTPSCTRKPGYKLSFSQRPLRSARQMPSWTESHQICQPSHEAVMLIVVNPPQGGEDRGGIREAMQAREELPTYHRQTHHAPSFIGGDAAIRLIGLQQAQCHDSTREAERHAERFVFANVYSRVPTCRCCLRQRSSL